MISIASWGVGPVDIARFEAGLGLEDAEEQRERRGAQHAVGVDRDDAVGQRVQVADVLAGHVVGGVPLLAVARLVQTHNDRPVAQCLTEQLQPLAAQRLHRPVGMREEVVQRLRVGVDRLAQTWQGLPPRLGEQAKMEGGELLEVPYVLEQTELLGTVLIDAGHRRGRRAHAGHGATSFGRHQPAHSVPKLTDEGTRRAPREEGLAPHPVKARPLC